MATVSCEAVTTLGSERPEVLVVDEHRTSREKMSTWLEASGYRVRQATDGSDAWQSAQIECPPIVVATWSMPHMSGVELCRSIRESHGSNQVYVLIATAADSHVDLTEAVDAGANDFLSQPIREDEFLARIRNAELSLQRLRNQTELAEIDSLTGLLNRRTFFQQGQQLLDTAQKTGGLLACIALDIDHFKKFNDDHGHIVGDRILVAVSRILREACRQQDLICRLGGDEFCMLLRNVNEQDAREVAERIRRAVASNTIELDGEASQTSVTLGVAPLSHGMDTMAEFVDTTDRVLIAAKNEGRGQTLCLSSMQHRRSDFRADASCSHSKLQLTKASAIMADTTILVYEDQTLRAALEILLRSEKDCACVVDRSSCLVGMITERDFLNAFATGEIDEACVRNVMSRNLARFREDTPVTRIWESLQRNPMLRNVIVDEEGVPIGILRRHALLRLLNEQKRGRAAD